MERETARFADAKLRLQLANHSFALYPRDALNEKFSGLVT
jgi:hypothetical protein